MIKIALCGMGYRGRNLFRALSAHPGPRLEAVVQALRNALAMTAPHAPARTY